MAKQSSTLRAGGWYRSVLYPSHVLKVMAKVINHPAQTIPILVIIDGKLVKSSFARYIIEKYYRPVPKGADRLYDLKYNAV